MSVEAKQSTYTPKTDPATFYASPSRRRRTILRWLVYLVHLIPFAGVVFFYPELQAQVPQLFAENIARFALPAWGGVVVIHFLIVALLDLREGVVFARKDRKYRQQIQTEINRTRMLENLYGQPEQTES